jgi:hypothetical protein
MNVRLQLGTVIHSYVVNESLVDGSLLIEDDNYTSLLTKLLNKEKDMINLNSQAIKEELLSYVNNNY